MKTTSAASTKTHRPESTTELVDALAREIAASYPVGGLLPSEAQLQERFGTTRYRLREAMSALRKMGVVESRAGIGTTVLSRTPSPSFVQSQQTLEGIVEAARTTQLRLVRAQTLPADASTARMLRVDAGTRWMRIDMLRYMRGQAEPIGSTCLYVRPEFDQVPARIDQWVGPVFKLIERLYEVRVASVEQEIDACTLDEGLAAQLQAPSGSAALKVTRHWYDAGGKLIQCSVGLYPEGRSRYRSRLVLEAPSAVPTSA